MRDDATEHDQSSTTKVTRTAGPARRRCASSPAIEHGAAGTVIADRFEVERPLGCGGMGELTLVRDRWLGDRRVVLKRARRDYEPGRRRQCTASVRREGRALACFDHPAIVTVFDALRIDGDPALVLAHVAGGSLDEQGPLPLRAALRLAVDLCGALAHVHAAGWLHLDVKLENVLVTRDGGAKLIDFGIAQRPGPVEPLVPGVVGMLGTPRIMSPEQAAGAAVDARADVYSLGILLQELTEATPGVPPVLDALINQMLEPEPALRPFSAAEIGARLAAIARGVPVHERSTRPKPRGG